MLDDGDQFAFFESVLFECFGYGMAVDGFDFVHGGCINNAVKLETEKGAFFLKWNENTADDMFDKEARGLGLLKENSAVTIPEVLGVGQIGDKSYLLVEYINGYGSASDYWEDFAKKLADMHRTTAPYYGLDFDNYIGRLPQSNDQYENWIDFFIERRLEVQVTLALYNDLIDKKLVDRFRAFYKKLPDLLPVDQPALIHGDLWAGNVIADADGKVSLIDPAVYYANREIELAFTQMFGGFAKTFYDTYFEAFPVEPGFDERVSIYNLYPLMVHVNLFGTSYLSGVKSVLKRYT